MNEDLTGRRVHQKVGEQELGPLIGVIRAMEWHVELREEAIHYAVGLLIETPTGDLIVMDFEQVRVAK